MKTLESFIMPTQTELFDLLCNMYAEKAEYVKGDYIIVPGDAPILLVAHLDTVHKERVKYLCRSKDKNILMSPEGIGGDDRCGVYALHAIHERAAVKPWLLFTCDEEIGAVGAEGFVKDYNKGYLPPELDNIKAIVEIDRRGANDAVYYDCDNKEFEDYITGKGFETEFGSFSDISTIAPALGVAAVNLSSGYYNAHTLYEYINRAELNMTIERVLSIVEDATAPDFPKYEYVEAKRTYSLNKYGWKSGWYDYDYSKWYDEEDGEEETEEEHLKKIPEEIRNEYAALLDVYDMQELDDIALAYGDAYIRFLFESEFGGTYEEIFGKEDTDEAEI